MKKIKWILIVLILMIFIVPSTNADAAAKVKLNTENVRLFVGDTYQLAFEN